MPFGRIQETNLTGIEYDDNSPTVSPTFSSPCHSSCPCPSHPHFPFPIPIPPPHPLYFAPSPQSVFALDLPFPFDLPVKHLDQSHRLKTKCASRPGTAMRISIRKSWTISTNWFRSVRQKNSHCSQNSQRHMHMHYSLHSVQLPMSAFYVPYALAHTPNARISHF